MHQGLTILVIFYVFYSHKHMLSLELTQINRIKIITDEYYIHM